LIYPDKLHLPIDKKKARRNAKKITHNVKDRVEQISANVKVVKSKIDRKTRSGAQAIKERAGEEATRLTGKLQRDAGEYKKALIEIREQHLKRTTRRAKRLKEKLADAKKHRTSNQRKGKKLSSRGKRARKSKKDL